MQIVKNFYEEIAKEHADYPNSFPTPLKTSLDSCFLFHGPHRTNVACAEPMLLAFYLEETGEQNIPLNTPLIVYGRAGLSGKHGFQKPCSRDGMNSGCKGTVRQ